MNAADAVTAAATDRLRARYLRATGHGWLVLLVGCGTPAGEGGASTDIISHPTPVTTDGLVTTGGFAIFGLERNGDGCWSPEELAVPIEYWADFATWGTAEDGGGVCGPVAWTAVYQSRCEYIASVCPDDPRDPEFHDCSELDDCCDSAEAWGGCSPDATFE